MQLQVRLALHKVTTERWSVAQGPWTASVSVAGQGRTYASFQCPSCLELDGALSGKHIAAVASG